jgi:hypothetical protein
VGFLSRFLVSSICALALVDTGGLAGAASSKASSARISAHLTKTSFKSSQAGAVKLIYSFSATSKSFGYLLTFKKGPKWRTVKSVKKKGTFKGSKSMTVRKVFAGKPVKVGRYRLELSADGGRKLLSFKVGGKPANTSRPAISGTTAAGQTLLAGKGSWSNSPSSYTHRWRRCNSSGVSCSNISGATSSSYVLDLVDVGSTIRVVVRATNTYGAPGPTSRQTAVVSGPVVTATAPPTISGTTTQGQMLTSSTGSWINPPISFAYQWRRCDGSGANCSDISGASSSTYTLTSADVGSTIRVVVTASYIGFCPHFACTVVASGSATSAQTAVVAGLPPG